MGEQIVIGAVTLMMGAFISLAVYAVNAKVNSARTEGEKKLLELEVKISREYIAPLASELRALVQTLREDLNIRDEMRNGFDQQANAAKRNHSETMSRLPISARSSS